mmetsp:Transcript_23283/g.45807  ORF Transcript_23283/g.45807 Transcript_23283/m.45807 type:complete len:240 (-) Transcript_23283:287-1006(-)
MEEVGRHGGFLLSEGPHGCLHPVESRGLPDELHSKVCCQVVVPGTRCVLRQSSKLQCDLLVAANLHNLTRRLPHRPSWFHKFQSQLISHNCLPFVIVPAEEKVSHPLLVHTRIPPNSHTLLPLPLFDHAVVISLQLHQRTKRILIIIRIVVPQANGGRFIVHSRLVNICNRRLRCHLPQLLQLRNLTCCQAAGTPQICTVRNFQQPGEQTLVLNQRGPPGHIPPLFLHRIGGQTRLSAD